MVIKGSATKRNGERGFTQPLMWNKKERKKKEETEGRGEERRGCVGARTEKKKRKTTEKGQGGKWGNRERERGREIRKV